MGHFLKKLTLACCLPQVWVLIYKERKKLILEALQEVLGHSWYVFFGVCWNGHSDRTPSPFHLHLGPEKQ